MTIPARLRGATVALPLLLAAVSPLPAMAGDHGSRHFTQHNVSHFYQRGDQRSFNRRAQGRRYDRGYRRGYRQGRQQRSRRSSNRGAYLVGGLVVGSLITHALTRPRYEHYSEQRSTRVVGPAPSYRSQAAPAVGRRLFRDRDGNCYERSSGAAGEEVLIALPAQDCAW